MTSDQAREELHALVDEFLTSAQNVEYTSAIALYGSFNAYVNEHIAAIARRSTTGLLNIPGGLLDELKKHESFMNAIVDADSRSYVLDIVVDEYSKFVFRLTTKMIAERIIARVEREVA